MTGTGQEEEEVRSLPSEVTAVGCVVVACGFVANLLLVGLFQGQSVFLAEWHREFDVTLFEASLMTGMIPVVLGIFSPLGGVLATYFGSRIVAMIGGLIVALGMIGTTLVNSVIGVILTWGVIVGAGFALVYTPTVAMVSLYFDKHFTTANGIVYAGSAVGQIIIPLMTGLFIDKYGWRGAVLLLAGIMCNLIACGAALRPNRKQSGAKNDRQLKARGHVNEAFQEQEIGHSSKIAEQNGAKTDLELQTNGLHAQVNAAYEEESEVEQSTKSDGASFAEGSQTEGNVHKVKNTQIASNEMGTDRTISSMFIVLLTNLNFDLVLVTFFLTGYIFFGPIAHTIPRALATGISESQASYLPTIQGAGSLVGRLAPGFFADYFQTPRDVMTIIAFFICCISNILSLFFVTFWHHATYHFIYGGASGVLVVFMYTIGQVILPLDLRKLGVGLFTLFLAGGDTAGALLTGQLFDVTGNYDVPSWVFAGCSVLGATCLTIVAILTRRKTTSKEEVLET